MRPPSLTLRDRNYHFTLVKQNRNMVNEGRLLWGGAVASWAVVSGERPLLWSITEGRLARCCDEGRAFVEEAGVIGAGGYVRFSRGKLHCASLGGRADARR